MDDRRRSLQPVAASLVAGLVVLVTLLGLIGTAIRDPRPHDIPVGVAGPSEAVQQLTTGFSSKAPGTFLFTTYSTETDARAALDSNDVDAVLVVGSGPPRLIVSGAAGDAVAGVITAIFSSAFAAQGTRLSVEVVHAFTSGDPHGLVLFFLVLATIVSTFVAQVVLFVRGGSARMATWLVATSAWALVAGLTGVGMAAWLVGGYDTAAAAGMVGLMALASLAAGTVTAGFSRILGAPGIGLAGLVVVLLDLISSGGPAGPQFLPDAYRALSPWMPAAQLSSALRSALYFDGNGVAQPAIVMTAWVVVGLVLMLVGEATRSRVRMRAARTAVSVG
jgi:hypothetical protein